MAHINWKYPRFVLKTKDVSTHTLDDNVLFTNVRHYDEFVDAFLPRLLVDDMIQHAPNGVYCWILRAHEEGIPHLYAMKVISEQEIGSLHSFLFILSSDRSQTLTANGRFRFASQVIAAGEFRVNTLDQETVKQWNLQSGSFMAPLFSIKPLARSSPRTYKTAAQLADEVAEKYTLRNDMIRIVSSYLPGTFADMDRPVAKNSFHNKEVSAYVNAISSALGGEPFLHKTPIITSENNMEMLRALLIEDRPEPKKPKRGGTRRTHAYKRPSRRMRSRA